MIASAEFHHKSPSDGLVGAVSDDVTDAPPPPPEDAVVFQVFVAET